MLIQPVALWDFSLKIYQDGDVQTSLLDWQNSYGANVNVALFCLYCDEYGLIIDSTNLKNLHQHISAFSVPFTQSLRSTRDQFKQKKSHIEHYKQIREHLLAAELLLEKQEQRLICEWVNREASVYKKGQSSSDNWPRYQQLLS